MKSTVNSRQSTVKIKDTGKSVDRGPSTVDLAQELNTLKSVHLYRSLRTLDNLRAAHATIDGRPVTLFCGNDYLGLSSHPEVIEASQKAAKDFGVGAGASRLISGTSRLAAELEKRIAQFKNKGRALVFSSGYLANLGIISAFCGKTDLIVMIN